MKTALLVAFLILPSFVFAQLNGTRTVCVSGCDYTSLTLAGGAFAAINSAGINGNLVLEIRSDLTTETGANVLANFTDINGPHTITIRPNNNTMRTISGTNNAQGLIVLAGADRVIIDGRDPSNSTLDYTNRYLTIVNASTTASTLAISNDAVSCSIRSVIVEGSNTNTTGVVNVSGGSISGNDDLTIDYCDMKNGASLPRVGLNMDGGSQSNDNVQITNNRIFDFFNAASGATGINIGNLNSSILISGNSIYQTADRTATANINYRGIYINSASGSNFRVLNNFIGGTAAGATGAQRRITAPAGGYIRARLIEIQETGFSAASLVSGNTLRGVATTHFASTTAANASLYGILVSRGRVDVRSNIIGGVTAANISGTFTNATGRIAGIVFDTNSSGTGIIGEITNNNIDGLFVTSSGTSSGDRLQSVGIYIEQEVGTDPIVIKNNLIGNLVSGENFTTASGTTVSTGTYVAGIYASTSIALSIDRNKISRLGNRVGSNSQFFGIHLNNPISAQVTSNQIFNFVGSNNSSDYDIFAGVFVYQAGSGPVRVAKNLIRAFVTSSGGITNGILMRVATTSPHIPRVENNMITLGDVIAREIDFRGIYVRGAGSGVTTGSIEVFANSIVITGAASGTSNTQAFYRSSEQAGPLFLRANIFLNNRSGGTGRHTALHVDALPNLTTNHNLLFASVAGDLTNTNSTYRNFANWQTASGQDANSTNFDISPKFMSVTGGNLRIPHDNSSDVLNNVVDKGAANAGSNPVNDDIDNATRANITDIGASEVTLMWLGTTSSNWATSTNWSGGIIPSCGGRETIKIGPNLAGIVLNQPNVSGTTIASFRELILLEGSTLILSGSSQLNQCATAVSPDALIVNGTLTVSGAQPITLYGDFHQNNVFTTGTGNVSFIGSMPQSINGDANPVTFNNLTINGTGVKTLNRSARVNGTLALTNGRVTTTTTNILTLSTAATYTGSSNTSFINGPMAKETNFVSPRFVFPIGKGGKIRPAAIEPSNTLASTFSAEYFNQSAIDNIGTSMEGSIITVSDLEYWRITRSGSANAFVTLTWDFASGISADQADRDLLGVVRWNGSQWSNHYQSANIGTQESGEVTSQFVGVFDTYFTLGSSTTNNPLPIELLYFRAALAEGMVRTEWATEMERDFDRFELEKASKDLIFTKIGEVQSLSSGEPRMIRNYSYVDQTPYIGDNYYRLKAIDMDGTFQYYNVVKVFNLGEGTLNVYPNPIVAGSEALKVKVDFTPTLQDNVTLLNLQGVEILHTNIQVGGVHEISLGTHVKPGFYLLRYNSPAFQKTFKVIVK